MWRWVEVHDQEAWDAEYTRLLEGTQDCGPCPSCGEAPLRFFFHRVYPGDADPSFAQKAGYWAWCPACRRYEHATMKAPDWWPDIDYPPGRENWEHDIDWFDGNWEWIVTRRYASDTKSLHREVTDLDQDQ